MSKVIAIDFDGTIVEQDFPNIGKPIPLAIEAIKQLRDDGHKLILWTCRDGEYLAEAVDYCVRAGLTFDAVNDNIGGGGSRKIFADVYIDDRAVTATESLWHTVVHGTKEVC